MTAISTVAVIIYCANCNNRPIICRKTYTTTAKITRYFTINIRTTLNPTCAGPCIHSYMTATGTVITVIVYCANCNNIPICRKTHTVTALSTSCLAINIVS